MTATAHPNTDERKAREKWHVNTFSGGRCGMDTGGGPSRPRGLARGAGHHPDLTGCRFVTGVA